MGGESVRYRVDGASPAVPCGALARGAAHLRDAKQGWAWLEDSRGGERRRVGWQAFALGVRPARAARRPLVPVRPSHFRSRRMSWAPAGASARGRCHSMQRAPGGARRQHARVSVAQVQAPGGAGGQSARTFSPSFPLFSNGPAARGAPVGFAARRWAHVCQPRPSQRCHRPASHCRPGRPIDRQGSSPPPDPSTSTRPRAGQRAAVRGRPAFRLTSSSLPGWQPRPCRRRRADAPRPCCTGRSRGGG